MKMNDYSISNIIPTPFFDAQIEHYKCMQKLHDEIINEYNKQINEYNEIIKLKERRKKIKNLKKIINKK
jgi:hypothetical protein